MTTRERRMSVILIGFILVVGVGFFGYQFIVSPLKAKKDQLAALQDDVDQREARIARITKRQGDLAAWKKLSLPPDAEKKTTETAVLQPGKSPADNARADLAQRDYEDELNKMLRAAGYAAADIVGIIPKKPDAKSSPALANKKPIYTKLVFTVQLKGDLASLVDFLGRFYKVRLMHQIRNITIQKPIGADMRAAADARAAAAAANAQNGQNGQGGQPGQGGQNAQGGPGGQGGQRGQGAQQQVTPSTDLDVTLTIEALVLDTAEQRKTLLPDKTPDLPPLLARTDAQYAMIAGKNMFFGPSPVSRVRTGPDDSLASFFDPSQYMKLNAITSGDNGWEAWMYDVFHNWDYRIAPRRTGGYQVDVSYILGGRKRTDGERSGKTIALRNSDGDVIKEWLIVKIDRRDVILRDDAKGDYFALHIGDSLAQKEKLSKSQLDEMGIKMEPAKPPAKGTNVLDDINDPGFDP
jgi:hypothetical protein